MRSFLYAFRGLFAALREERHMRIHACFAFYVVLAGFVTRLTVPEWGVVLLCCGLVLGLECLNSALERLCDRITTERDERIGWAKDAAAGAVLVSAVFSAAAGCVLFFSGGRPERALRFATERPWAAALIVLTLPVWLYFIFGRKHK